MSLLTISNAKFQKFSFKSKDFSIFSIHINREDAYAIEELIARDLVLSKHLNNTNRPKISMMCQMKSIDFINCNYATNTLIDFEIAKIEFNGKYNNFTLIMENFSEVEISYEEKIHKFIVDNLPGFREARATQLIEKFGAENLENIFKDNQSIKQLCQLNFIKEIELQDLFNAWHNSYYKLALFDKCKTLNLKPAIIHKAIEVFGHAAYENLIKPYHMAVYQDPVSKKFIHILNWDDIQTMRLPTNAIVSEKIKMSAAYRLAYYELANEMGSTVVPFEKLAYIICNKYLKNEIKSNQIDLEYIFSFLNKFSTTEKKFLDEEKSFIRIKEKIVKGADTENPNNYWVTINQDYKLELFLIQKIKEFLNVSQKKFSHEDIEDFKNKDTPLDPTQKNAVITSMMHNLLYITGGPGTGKTYTIEWIIKTYAEKGLSYTLVAPTAKAANCIIERTGNMATTVHHMFKIMPDDVENAAIETVNTTNEEEDYLCDSDLLIIDESSMLSMALVAKVLSKINPLKTTVIFIGDKDQLPSIERGCFFEDIIKSDIIPGARLEVLHRQKENSSIAKNARNLRLGLPCDTTDCLDGQYIQCNSDLEIQEEVLRIHQELQEQQVSILDIQTLTPQNNTCVGVDDLNPLIKNIFNPKTETNKTSNYFCIGDKVMQTINNEKLDSFNGSVGIVQSYSDENDLTFIKFGEKEDSKETKVIAYEKANIAELKLAYAITTHKSQGSDYSYVILVLSPTHRKMLRKRLLYTGFTRPKTKIICIGDLRYLEDPSFLLPEEQRYTNFSRLLKKINLNQFNQETDDIPAL